jgi:hypothetical protein
MKPLTRTIGSGRHRLIIAEHPDSCYIASSVDGASVGGFYTAEDVWEMIVALWAIYRRVRRRGNVLVAIE